MKRFQNIRLTGKQKKVLGRILASGFLLILLTILRKTVPARGTLPLWITALCYLAPYAIIGYDILRKAIKGILHGQFFDECFLMALATLGALALGEFAEGVCVMLFYQIGELFQSYAVMKSRRSIAELMDIRPDYANVEGQDGSLEQVDPDTVAIGQTIVILPGEKVPIDGIVIEGVSSLDTASLTGESLPRGVTPGDEVLSGCVNQSGLLKVRTTREFGTSTASKILELVENSGMKKSRSENFITRFARIYTPAVVICAILLALLPPLIRVLLGLPAAFPVWIMRAFTFLVISCPCALVVSIPLSFFGGIGAASRQGVLVKGSVYLELLSRIRIMAFDKTGTLTRGVFEVAKLDPEGISGEELLRMTALAESRSSHPVARSILNSYEASGAPALDLTLVTSLSELSGKGVRADIAGRSVLAGSPSWLESEGISIPRFPMNRDASTLVCLALDGVFRGTIHIVDKLKDTSAEAMAELDELGIRRRILLSGDQAETAAAVGSELSMSEVYAPLLPGEKVDKVEFLLSRKRDKEVLAFVGDGLNDAPVLTRADIGIAMGALGSDAAIEAADIVLMDDDPLSIPKAIRISRKCLRIVKENILFALAVKLICLGLGAFGLAGMWLAIFADVGVMVLAVLNAIRTLKIEKGGRS